jgi:hypothetical protein
MSLPWNDRRGSNAIRITDPSEILGFQRIGDGRKCGTNGFIGNQIWPGIQKMNNLPVRSNAEMNVAIRRLRMINQKRISLGVALAPSSSRTVSSLVVTRPRASCSLDTVGSDGGSCVLGDMALIVSRWGQ